MHTHTYIYIYMYNHNVLKLPWFCRHHLCFPSHLAWSNRSAPLRLQVVLAQQRRQARPRREDVHGARLDAAQEVPTGAWRWWRARDYDVWYDVEMKMNMNMIWCGKWQWNDMIWTWGDMRWYNMKMTWNEIRWYDIIWYQLIWVDMNWWYVDRNLSMIW